MKKKIFSLASVLLVAITMNAQTPGTTYTTTTTTTGKTASLQIRAGVNFQNLNGKIEGSNADGDILTAFHAGIEVPIMIAPEFYIQPGALYSMKGAVSKNNSDIKTKLSYIEVPINFVYKPMLGMGNLILGVGPYMGIAISGKIKNGSDDTKIKFDNKITALQAETDPYYKRLDFGGNLLAGYQFSSKFFFQLNAQLGMTNILPEVEGTSTEDHKLKNTGFGLSLGYAL